MNVNTRKGARSSDEFEEIQRRGAGSWQLSSERRVLICSRAGGAQIREIRDRDTIRREREREERYRQAFLREQASGRGGSSGSGEYASALSMFAHQAPYASGSQQPIYRGALCFATRSI